MHLQRVEVLIGDETAMIEGDTLEQVTIGGKTTLSPSVRTAVLVFLSSSDVFPSAIRHRVTVKQATDPNPVSVECAGTSVGHKEVVRISPPVRGNGWSAGNSPNGLVPAAPQDLEANQVFCNRLR